jgi:nucleoside-diphosphate-sugar epimerase
VRILAIGGSGFIGRFASSTLAAIGHEVTVFHRGERPAPAGVRAIHGDRRRLSGHADELRRARPDTVIDFILSNARQAIETADLFPGVRLIALSSCDVYRAAGILHGTEPGEPDNAAMTEEYTLRTNLAPYPAAILQPLRQVFPWLEDDYDKIPVERAVLAAHGTVLRLPMVYGPGDLLHRFRPIVKEVDGGSDVIAIDQSTADWRGVRGYVEDVAWAIALATVSPQAAGRIYNVGDSENFSELEWRRQIAGAAGYRGRFAIVAPEQVPEALRGRGDLRQHWVVDSNRIRRELGYAERVPRAEALARTIAWERGQA